MAATDSPVQARATAKYVRSAPRKAQLVADQIRGLPVPEARTVLAFSKRAVAKDVEKVLRSAVANAETNHDLIGDELVVHEIYVGEGPTLKRWKARARGRVGRIHKRTCHIVVGLAELDEELRTVRARDKETEAVTAADEAAETETTSDDVAADEIEDTEAVEAVEDTEAPAEAEASADEAESAEEAAVADAVDPDAPEPYEGYGEHTAKAVIALLGDLSDEQLDAVAAQDDRVTVLRGIEKERARRAEATTEDQEG